MRVPIQSIPVARAAANMRLAADGGGIAPSANPQVKFGCKNNVMIMLVSGVPGGPTILPYTCLEDQNLSTATISSSDRLSF